jgi:shikimate dehydrogenase
VDPSGKRIVVLGAGGAARAATVELALAGASHVTIVNRSPGRGRDLVELLNARTPARAELAAWPSSYRVPDGTQILVNATSIGLFPNVDDRPDIDYSSIEAGTVVCDVIHTPVTPFLAAAAKRGAQTVDGLGMLVYQGAIGFKLWTGLDAPVPVMHRALAKAFGLA